MKIGTAWARPLSGAVALAMVALAATACTDVKDSLESASKSLSGALNGDATADADAGQEALTGAALADSLYEQGLLLQGDGKDAEAFTHFRDAAEHGHGPAAYELGEAYNAGRGVDKDLNAGAKWINTAATRGEPRAQYAIGSALYNGAGMARDYTQAVRYLALAANQGHAGAQYLLGECYANGNGVTNNLPWAARWYGKAAAQGHADGTFSYGVVQAAGLGLPASLSAGYAWLDIASQRGHMKAGEVRAAIANKMTPAEIERGKRKSAAFTPITRAEFADIPTVMYVQHSLNLLGFNAGPVDGLAGPRTRSAVSAYLTSLGASGGAEGITPALILRLFEGQQSAA